MKIYSSNGIILLWSASPFVYDINLIYFNCDGIDTLEETEGIRVSPRVFAKWPQER